MCALLRTNSETARVCVKVKVFWSSLKVKNRRKCAFCYHFYEIMGVWWGFGRGVVDWRVEVGICT